MGKAYDQKLKKLTEKNPLSVRPLCPLSNYPMDLDKVEFLGALPLSNDFHMADFYTVNNNKDNLIKFTPMSSGTIKILI